MNTQAVIEVAELSDLLKDPELVILDCRYDLAQPDAGQGWFAQSHIPRAQYASLHGDLSGPHERYGGRHPLPSVEQFAEVARRLGISADSRVVVYDDQRLAFAARAWWLLRFFGLGRVSVLNGDFSAWREAGLPVESGEAQPVPHGTFAPSPDPAAVADHWEIYSGLANPAWQLVDARDPARFDGTDEPMDPVAGHIPSAINKPWQENTGEDGRLKSPQALREHWQDVRSDEPLICYCGSGVTACVNLLSLHLIGRDDARLYPGSWSDWCAHILHPTSHEAG
ncbi:sulfurtransferase [Microbulbifer zhoushanensis]|uniref:sulfurtransferase n=1 Tax=Microbulbifer zhoushanensis TaxID=2904254 RepID=UPI001F349658|nr:sulfurtransferase [Microbulbifer zhoushanensis]